MNGKAYALISSLVLLVPIPSILPRGLIDRPRQNLMGCRIPIERATVVSKRGLALFLDYHFGSPPSAVALLPASRSGLLSSEHIIDLMEREQDAIVLKLMREIDLLKAEVKHLRNGSISAAGGGHRKSSSVLLPTLSHKRQPSIFEETKKKPKVDPAHDALVEENRKLRLRIKELEQI